RIYETKNKRAGETPPCIREAWQRVACRSDLPYLTDAYEPIDHIPFYLYEKNLAVGGGGGWIVHRLRVTLQGHAEQRERADYQQPAQTRQSHEQLHLQRRPRQNRCYSCGPHPGNRTAVREIETGEADE